ncbi:hypothetical protein SVA_0187 [Sulfurifustis variabilis]|uniref:DUF2059 domain-containing protein n=1 Tax=Sulfurifustis variabilis TaxID=1675686 RepID=A0A1B4V025_9GAMM|nr:DUF2059 domain-containing protein [Sulfurifustis variabilis]BAU46769.1 hypothetical protein SVA_0187 [Sulfurifustis variabilis]
MRKAVVVLLACLTVLSAGPLAAEDLTRAKRADTRKLLEATGALKVGQAMSEAVVRQMSEAIKQARPDIPPQMFDVLAEEVNQAIAEEMNAKDGLVDLMVVLYHKYFTHREIRELLAFYESPVGRKAGSLAPVMSKEGFAIGQRWGESLGPRINRRVQARFKQQGYEI